MYSWPTEKVGNLSIFALVGGNEVKFDGSSRFVGKKCLAFIKRGKW